MGNSYLVACALAGMSVSIGAPAGFQPAAEVVARARAIAQQFGQHIEVFEDPALAVAGADVVTTDTWVSMGMEDEKEKRVKLFAGYTVDAALMAKANPSAIFLHCLPAYRGYEVAAEVLDGPQSRIWDEAENRLHAQKALMLWLSRQN
jgi:ornithine carbamoyltransferase